MLVPVALSMSAKMGASARPFLMAICFAASAEFMTQTNHEINTMVHGPGSYKFLDYMRSGAPLNLLFWIVATILIPYFGLCTICIGSVLECGVASSVSRAGSQTSLPRAPDQDFLRITRVEQDADRTTASATLPSATRLRPVRPWSL